MCLNRKVLIGAAVVGVGVGVWAFAPQAFGAALPLLVLAICPLSMLLMMKGMRESGGNTCHTERSRDVETAAQQAQSATGEPSVEELRTRLRALETQRTALADQLEAHARNQADAESTPPT